MKGRDFAAELRAEEATRQAEGIPPAASRAVWARLQGLEATTAGGRLPTLGRRRAVMIAGAAAIATIVLVVGLLRPPARRGDLLGDLEVASRSSDLAAHLEGSVLTIERGAVTLIDRPSGLTIATVAPVSLLHEARGVRLVRGRIDVTVAHRPPTAAPAAILVSDGAIEVMGTAFTVVQEQAGGQVALREGRIRFRAASGEVLTLRPGEALTWPLPASAPPPPPPSPPPSASAPSPSSSSLAPEPAKRAPANASVPARASALPSAASRPPSGEALLDQVEELRSRGQFAQAARTLRRALSGPPTPMRERLSFELGSLLTHQLGDARRACRQWDWHDHHFPDGRYRHEVARARTSLACRGGSGSP